MNVQIMFIVFSSERDDDYFADRERKRLLLKMLFESNNTIN